MTIFCNAWTHDTTEPFYPPVYRSGHWHIQFHPAIIALLLTTWLAVLAPLVWPSSSKALTAAQFAGLLSGGVLILSVIGYHIDHWHKRISYHPSLTPYTIGILEHLAVFGFFIAVLQAVVFR